MRTSSRILSFSFVIVSGLALGYAGRAYWERPAVDRVNAAISLFERYCIPFAQYTGEDRDNFRLSQKNSYWADRASLFVVELTPKTCQISEMEPHMNPLQRVKFAASAMSLVREKLPVLNNNDISSDTGFDFIDGLFQHPFGDQRRWGVLIYRWRTDGPRSETVLTILASQS